MNIIRTVVIAFMLIFFSVNSKSSENEPTDAKLKAHLLSKGNDFETLIFILNKTEYTSVLWVKDGPLTARIGNSAKAVWDKSPQLDEFVKKAIELGFGRFLIGVDNYGNWTIFTGKRVAFLQDEPNMLKTVNLDYWYGQKPKHLECTIETVAKHKNGTCYLPLKENWFLFKSWHSYDTKLE
jgi:hypothetical protein